MAQTIIGSSFTIEGDIVGEDDLLLQGTVKGSISLRENLIIEQSGVAEADISARTIEIAGQVTGDVAAAERVELKPEARLLGDLRTPRLNMADGAVISGNIDMHPDDEAAG